MGTHPVQPGMGLEEKKKKKDSWLSKKRIKVINKERGSGKTILVRKKSKCEDV